MNHIFGKFLRLSVVTALVVTSSLQDLRAQAPSPSIIPTSVNFPMIRGMQIDPRNGLNLSFLIDDGGQELNNETFALESEKLIKYFLTSLALPEKDLWVNLSPYEHDRITSATLSRTEMGKELLAQDYFLKRLTASLILPDDEIGKEVWEKIYARMHEIYGHEDVSIETLHKIWIMPESAEVFARGETVLITGSHLKVMLEEDYFAEAAGHDPLAGDTPIPSPLRGGLGRGSIEGEEIKDILRETILPIIEEEVNHGVQFAGLRQIFHALILARWFKDNLKSSLLGQVYADRSKLQGIDSNESAALETIYQKYLDAFRAGSEGVLKEDYDPATQSMTARKYITGGVAVPANFHPNNKAMLPENFRFDRAQLVSPKLELINLSKPSDWAMMDRRLFARVLAILFVFFPQMAKAFSSMFSTYPVDPVVAELNDIYARLANGRIDGKDAEKQIDGLFQREWNVSLKSLLQANGNFEKVFEDVLSQGYSLEIQRREQAQGKGDVVIVEIHPIEQANPVRFEFDGKQIAYTEFALGPALVDSKGLSWTSAEFVHTAGSEPRIFLKTAGYKITAEELFDEMTRGRPNNLTELFRFWAFENAFNGARSKMEFVQNVSDTLFANFQVHGRQHIIDSASGFQHAEEMESRSFIRQLMDAPDGYVALSYFLRGYSDAKKGSKGQHSQGAGDLYIDLSESFLRHRSIREKFLTMGGRFQKEGLAYHILGHLIWEKGVFEVPAGLQTRLTNEELNELGAVLAYTASNDDWGVSTPPRSELYDILSQGERKSAEGFARANPEFILDFQTMKDVLQKQSFRDAAEEALEILELLTSTQAAAERQTVYLKLIVDAAFRNSALKTRLQNYAQEAGAAGQSNDKILRTVFSRLTDQDFEDWESAVVSDRAMMEDISPYGGIDLDTQKMTLTSTGSVDQAVLQSLPNIRPEDVLGISIKGLTVRPIPSLPKLLGLDASDRTSPDEQPADVELSYVKED